MKQNVFILFCVLTLFFSGVSYGVNNSQKELQQHQISNADPLPCVTAASAAKLEAEYSGVDPEILDDIFWGVLNDCLTQLTRDW